MFTPGDSCVVLPRAGHRPPGDHMMRAIYSTPQQGWPSHLLSVHSTAIRIRQENERQDHVVAEETGFVLIKKRIVFCFLFHKINKLEDMKPAALSLPTVKLCMQISPHYHWSVNFTQFGPWYTLNLLAFPFSFLSFLHNLSLFLRVSR